MKKQLDTQLNRAEKYQEVQADDYKNTALKGILQQEDLNLLCQTYADTKQQEECLNPQTKTKEPDKEM